jgi:lysophospholipase L1-like esterase
MQTRHNHGGAAWRGLVMRLAVLAALGTCLPAAAVTDPAPRWSGAWSAAPQPYMPGALDHFSDRSLRLIAHLGAGGHTLRIRLSNTYGLQPLHIGAAHLARRRDGAAIDPASDRVLHFSGHADLTLAAGASALSDPVDLEVSAQSDLAVSLYLPDATAATTSHFLAMQTGYVSAGAGDSTGMPEFAVGRTIESWPFLTGVEVLGDGSSIVAFGDSLIDGDGSTPDANRRWPDALAVHLQGIAVLNEGLIGNRLLRDSPQRTAFGRALGQAGVTRFARDALGQAGARYVVVRIGVNDLGFPGALTPAEPRPSAADLIAGYRQLIAQARAAGVRIAGATISPFEGARFARGYYTPQKERVRRQVNAWIRSSGEFDSVVDFDAVLRDPDRPQRLRPDYDSGDHLHPNDTGYAAVAAAVPVELFVR